MFKEYKVAVVASLPSLNSSQLDGQRGHGAFRKSVETLLRLNSEGFGRPESGLELNLVANPTGAFLPRSQAQLEKKFRNDLQRKWGIVFNKLFTFANVPLGRFRSWLEASGNLDVTCRVWHRASIHALYPVLCAEVCFLFPGTDTCTIAILTLPKGCQRGT